MKKVVSMLLAVIMLCGVFTVPAYAQSEDTTQIQAKGKLADYVFKKYTAEEAEAIADAIVASSPEHWVMLTETGDITYCVSICIDQNPEIGNIVILKKTSEKLIDKTVEMCVIQGIDSTLLDRNHFTGELSLHVLAMLVMESLHQSLWPNFARYYEMFSRADMNPEESRIPPAIIRFIGLIITGLF